MKKILLILFLLLTGVAQAVDVSDSNYSAEITITNTSGSTQTNITVPLPLSATTLINNGYAVASGLNIVVHDSAGADVPLYIGTSQTDTEAVLQSDGGVFTDYSSQANSPTINDVIPLPATPVVDDAVYIGFHNRARYAYITSTTAGAGTWAITWEYYTGSAWAALTGVSDGTNGFHNTGTRLLSYNLPTNWSESTVNSITSWWIRGRVSSFTSITVQPLIDYIDYETAIYWLFVPSIANGVSLTYTVYVGGSNTLTNYSIAGTSRTIPDNATLEIGRNDFVLLWRGYVGTGTGTLIQKSGSFGLELSPAGTVRGFTTDGVTTIAVTSPISSSYHKVELIRTSGVLTLEIDDVQVDTTDDAVSATIEIDIDSSGDDTTLSENRVYFFDSFEDGNYSDWNGVGAFTVTEISGDLGDRSLRIINGSEGEQTLTYSLSEAVSPTIASFKIMNSGTTTGGLFGIEFIRTGVILFAVRVRNYNGTNNVIEYLDPPWSTALSGQGLNSFFNLTLVISYSGGGSFLLYNDTTLIGSFSFNSPGTAIDSIVVRALYAAADPVKTADKAIDAITLFDSGNYFTNNDSSALLGAIGYDNSQSSVQAILSDVSLKFDNVTVPNGSIIEDAYLLITPSVTRTNDVLMYIYGNATDTASAPTSVAQFSALDETNTRGYWRSNDGQLWTLNTELQLAPTATDYSSASKLTTIVQEIVDRAGWVSGNSLQLMLQSATPNMNSEDPDRRFYSYDGSPTRVATLHIAYKPRPSVRINTTINTTIFESAGAATSVELQKPTPDLGRALIYFDLSTIPANASVLSATLGLRNGSSNSQVQNLTLSAHRVSRAWVDGQVDWSNASTGVPWTTPGGDYDAASATTTPSYLNFGGGGDFINFNVLDLVDWDTATNTSFIIKYQTETGAFEYMQIDALVGSSQVFARPQLQIEYSIGSDIPDVGNTMSGISPAAAPYTIEISLAIASEVGLSCNFVGEPDCPEVLDIIQNSQEYGNRVTDQSGTGNHGTIVLPTPVDGVSVSIRSMLPISYEPSTYLGTVASDASVTTNPIVVPENITITNPTAGSGLPGYEFLLILSQRSGIPIIFIWGWLVTIVAVIGMGLSYVFTRNEIFTVLVGGLVYSAAWQAGIWDLYLLILFSIIGACVVMLTRRIA